MSSEPRQNVESQFLIVNLLTVAVFDLLMDAIPERRGASTPAGTESCLVCAQVGFREFGMGDQLCLMGISEFCQSFSSMNSVHSCVAIRILRIFDSNMHHVDSSGPAYFQIKIRPLGQAASKKMSRLWARCMDVGISIITTVIQCLLLNHLLLCLSRSYDAHVRNSTL
jgi:hypothetical protein